MNQNKNYIFPISIIGLLFFIFGFITWANSQLIPYLKIACELTDTQSYLVGSAFFAAYFFMSIPSSYILEKVGFKKGMSLGLFVMAIGALLFIPAANARNYSLFLLGLFIIGTGLALLQTASNPYVVILGPKESAAQRISIMGVCNKLAGICAVYLLSSIILSNGDEIVELLPTLSATEKANVLQELANRVINPYLIIALLFALLGVGLFFIKLPEVQNEEEVQGKENQTTKLFQHRNLVLGAVALFFYVGAEVISYDAFTNFGTSLGFTTSESALFASFTGYAMLAGYFVGIFAIPKFISQRKALFISASLSILFAILAINTSGWVAVSFFALLGFSESVMWPAIWPLALDGLGKHTKLGSAILVMMIVGGAILMPLMGVFADLIDSVRHGFYILVPCYLVILFYAVNGYKSKYSSIK